MADVSERCGDVDPDAEAADGAVAVEELGVAFGAGAFMGEAEVQDPWFQLHAGGGDDVLGGPGGVGGVQGVVADADAVAQAPVIGVRGEPAGIVWIDGDVAAVDGGGDGRASEDHDVAA